jgi:hypothetical protein
VRLHDVDPLHASIDGRLVTVVNGKVEFDPITIEPGDAIAPFDENE